MPDVIQYRLSDRPNWWLPKIFKWLSVIIGVFGVVTYLSSLALYASADALYAGSDEWEKSSQVLLGSTLEELSSTLLDSLFVVAFLWLLAIGVDKLDEIVWLNATDQDRSEIIQKRTKNKKS